MLSYSGAWLSRGELGLNLTVAKILGQAGSLRLPMAPTYKKPPQINPHPLAITREPTTSTTTSHSSQNGQR